jgi:predicted Rossmann fold nucleotide-binding protein DprA/Smf involved in DNA uptake
MGSPMQDKKVLIEQPILAGDQGKVFKAIGHDVVSPDELVLVTDLATHDISAVLVDLEIRGFICRERAGYIRVPVE